MSGDKVVGMVEAAKPGSVSCSNCGQPTGRVTYTVRGSDNVTRTVCGECVPKVGAAEVKKGLIAAVRRFLGIQ